MTVVLRKRRRSGNRRLASCGTFLRGPSKNNSDIAAALVCCPELSHLHQPGDTMTTATSISPTDLMLREFREEAAATKRILERVPADKLTWKPHDKSMSLGQLSYHIALIPKRIASLVQADHFDVSTANFNPPPPANLEEVHAAFAESVRAAEA